MTRSQPRVTVLEPTASRCRAEAVQRKHVFMVEGHSALLAAMGPGEFVRSNTFDVAGYDWSVNYYPHGDGSRRTGGYASVHLELLGTVGAQARASCELSLVDRCTGAPKLVSRTAPTVFCRGGDDGCGHLAQTSRSVKRSKVVAASSSPYVHGDSIWIECVVTVFKRPMPSRRATPPSRPSPPPSQLQDMVADALQRALERRFGSA